MQIKDNFIDVALSLPAEKDGNVLLGAIARYLRTGEEPKRLRTM